MMTRRTFLLAVSTSLLAAPVGVRAQGDRGATTWRIGVLWPGAAPPQPPRLEAFREGLREAGPSMYRRYRIVDEEDIELALTKAQAYVADQAAAAPKISALRAK